MDRDIELIFIQFRDVPVSYSVELLSKNETVDGIKECLKKEYPNGRHLKPHEVLVWKNQELKDGQLYNLPKNTTLHVRVPSSPINLKEKEGPWDLGVIQSVKQGQLELVDLLTVDEPFYSNPFIKPKVMYYTPSPNLRRIMTVEDERSRVCDKRARMSPPHNAAASSHVIDLVTSELSPRASVGIAKKRGRPVGSTNKKTSVERGLA